MLVEELLKAADRGGVRVRSLARRHHQRWPGPHHRHPRRRHRHIQTACSTLCIWGAAPASREPWAGCSTFRSSIGAYHNKLWLAENSMAIVGGRNLGDEYFDAEPESGISPTSTYWASVGCRTARTTVSTQYWNSALSKPIGRCVRLQQADCRGSAKYTHAPGRISGASRQQNHALYQQLMKFATEPRLDIWRQELDLGLEPGFMGCAEQGLAKGRARSAIAADHAIWRQSSMASAKN